MNLVLMTSRSTISFLVSVGHGGLTLILVGKFRNIQVAEENFILIDILVAAI